MLLFAYSDGQTVAEIQADLVARRRACVQTRIGTFFQPLGQLRLFCFFFSSVNPFFQTPDYSDLSVVPVESEKMVGDCTPYL